MAGSSPFNVINFFLTEFAKFSEKHLGKTPLCLSFQSKNSCIRTHNLLILNKES